MPLPPQYSPDRGAFHQACRRGNLVPIYREIVADGDTPVSAFARLGRRDYGFLLESVVGGEKWAAYSFIGVAPRAVLRVRKGRAEITRFLVEDGGRAETTTEPAPDPAVALSRFVGSYRAVADPALPRFFGGAVGYLGYDAVRSWEPVPSHAADDLHLPEAVFVLSDTLVIFDNLRQTVKVVACAAIEEGADEAARNRAYDAACARVDALVGALAGPAPRLRPLDLSVARDPGELASRTPREAFLEGVRRIKEHILAGDAFQVVLSQRFEAPRGGADPFDAYRALRVINPSPYMFHLQLPDVTITGASPETLVRLEGRRIELRPIAGTRPRGRDTAEDNRLEAELRADEKEIAEHVMLIDLGRNDVGRVARVGSVCVEEQMVVERYSHVMHLVSLVTGELRPELSAVDVLRAAFPAGTLSGAPKVRAMQIIEEIEPLRRGLYGGAVGYLSYPSADGGGSNMDLAIAIRTLSFVGDRVCLQAGAGVVHDSVPEAEYQESVNKARAAAGALAVARAASGER